MTTIRKPKNFQIIGNKYGKLTVLKEGDRKILPSGQKARQVICKCDCGKTHTVLISHLIRGRISSCGCLPKVMNGESNTHLGRLYRTIIYRCSEKYFQSYLYHQKGIKVCDEWENSFNLFKNWCLNNGYKHGLQIDRIDNTKGYSPDNCRFVNSIINCNNRHITRLVNYKGRNTPFMILIREKGLLNHATTILGRINRGWSIEDAFDTEIKKGNYFTGKRKRKNV